jgi:hypothetical protein
MASLPNTVNKIRVRKLFGLSIRQKLLLVSLSLLIIPWVGYEYVNEMEEYLQKRQEQRLLERARIIASLLADKPELFSTKLSTLGDTSGSKHLYVRPITSPIHIDGRTNDWRDYKDRIFEFTDPDVKPSSLSFKFQIGSYKPFLYVLFRVTDDKFLLRSKSGSRIDNGDHLQIAMQNSTNEYDRYIVSARQLGNMTAYRLPSAKDKDIGVIEEPRIVAFISKSKEGYDIELKIPLTMIGAKLAFAIADVDNRKTRKIENIVRTTSSDMIEEIGTIVVPSFQIQSLLARLHRPGSRIWITDTNTKVIALNGSLKEDDRDATGKRK